jgi:hypothetical protein
MAVSGQSREAPAIEPNPPDVVASIREVALDFMRLRERVIVTCFSVRAGEHEIMGYVRQVSVGSLSLSLLREHGGGTHGVPLEWVRSIRKAPPRKWVPGL